VVRLSTLTHVIYRLTGPLKCVYPAAEATHLGIAQ
jgi:hypothetical protein